MARLKKRVKKKIILVTFVLAIVLLGFFTFNWFFKDNEGFKIFSKKKIQLKPIKLL